MTNYTDGQSPPHRPLVFDRLTEAYLNEPCGLTVSGQTGRRKRSRVWPRSSMTKNARIKKIQALNMACIERPTITAVQQYFSTILNMFRVLKRYNYLPLVFDSKSEMTTLQIVLTDEVRKKYRYANQVFPYTNEILRTPFIHSHKSYYHTYFS